MELGFNYIDDILSCNGITVPDLADEFDTPLYLYDAESIEQRANAFRDAFNDVDSIQYALKANSNLSILKLIRSKGLGADVVSAGELALAIKAGFSPEEITFTGVGKRNDELAFAIEKQIGLIIAESKSEVALINDIAGADSRKPTVALRINPNIDAKTHKNISTGLHHNKFGMEENDLRELIGKRSEFKNIDLAGIHIHIGSQVSDSAPYIETAEYAAGLATELNRSETIIRIINLGGGLGVNYDKMLPGVDEYNHLTPEQLAKNILSIIEPTGCSLYFEPGRWIVAPSAILITRVSYIKTIGGNKFVITDAGMTDFMRPSLYQATHPIVPIINSDSPKEQVNIVGPICESTDSFAEDYLLPQVSEGALLAIMGVGAYGYSMSSNYNLHPRPAEVMIVNGKSRLIRKRETFDQMFEGMPDN